MTFNIYFIINIAIFCVITLAVVTISLIMLKKQYDEFGIASILGIVCWFIAMISYLFVGDPSMDEPNSAKTFGSIAGVIANFLFIFPPLANMLKNMPNTIRNNRKNRAARKEAKKVKVTVKVQNKTNVFDL